MLFLIVIFIIDTLFVFFPAYYYPATHVYILFVLVISFLISVYYRK